MDRIGNGSGHQYVLTGEAEPEQVQADPAPTGRLNWQSSDHRQEYAYSELAEQRAHQAQSSPPPPIKDENHVAHEVRTAPRSSFDRTRHASEKYWLNEAASCLVALGVLIAIICVLLEHDGQPLPEWKYGITLNALVSVLSTILKAATVMPLTVGISQAKWLWYVDSRPLKDIEAFDDASRGPWGSLLLLFDLRSHYIASFGAFLTIIALAVDPFTQQVVQTQECMRLDASAVARIPRANVYDRSGPKVIGTAGENSIWLPMAAAIYSSLISPPDNASAILTPVCPSGNCTFTESGRGSYQSIAMCHRCENITSLVRYHNNGSAQYNFTLPSGAYLENLVALSSTTNESTPRDDFPMFYLELIMFTNQSGPVAPNQPESDQPEPNNLLAAQCRLFPCVKTYSANISQNVFQEREISSQRIPRDNQSSFTLVSDQDIRNGTLRDCAVVEGADESAAESAVESTVKSTVPKRDRRASASSDAGAAEGSGENCNWRLSQGPDRAMRLLLNNLFNDNTLLYTLYRAQASMGDPWLRNIYQGGAASMDTVNQFIGGLANSITGQMRTEGRRDGSDEWAEGEVKYYRTCVRVNWPWLAFPAALLVLVVVFMGLTVVATLRTTWKEHGLETEAAKRIGFLKSSPLALLFFGLQRDVLEEAGHPTTASRMQDVAQETQVALKWSWYEGQWRFVKAKTVG